MYTPIFVKSYETFMATLWAENMLSRQFVEFYDQI